MVSWMRGRALTTCSNMRRALSRSSPGAGISWRLDRASSLAGRLNGDSGGCHLAWITLLAIVGLPATWDQRHIASEMAEVKYDCSRRLDAVLGGATSRHIVARSRVILSEIRIALML